MFHEVCPNFCPKISDCPLPSFLFFSSLHRTPLSKSLPLLGPAQKVVHVEKKSPFGLLCGLGAITLKIQEEPQGEFGTLTL
jgi:hypothetical protein